MSLIWSLYWVRTTKHEPVPVAARSKAEVCGCWPSEIVGSNLTCGMDVSVVSGVCVCVFVVSRGLRDELISRPEEFYTLWRVVVRDIETSWVRRHWSTGGGGSRAENKQKTKNMEFLCFFHPRSSKHHVPHPAFRDLFTCNSEECLRQRSISWDSSSFKKAQGFCSISPFFSFHALILHFVCWLCTPALEIEYKSHRRASRHCPLKKKRIYLLCVNRKSTLQISWKHTIRT